uniref:Uncharacterized protein n=1 Tax=Myxococcus xanthus TaxID=34 RepID=Q9APM7_MYXXA|nr:unknown [Myxococcus xanthus DK 1622]
MSPLPPLATPEAVATRASAPWEDGVFPGFQGGAGALLQLGEALRGLYDLVRLDDVTGLEVVEALDADTALEALRDFLDVVLEAPQRRHLPGEQLLVLAHEADDGAALHDAIQHRRTGDGAQTRHVEGVAHLRATQLALGADGLQQALHLRTNPVDELVDDGVALEHHFLGLGAPPPDSGLTLKPSTTPLEAAARITSPSVMAPTPEWTTSTLTLWVESFWTACLTASAEPCTSALMTTRSSLGPPPPRLGEQLLQGLAADLRQLGLPLLHVAVLGDLLGRLLVRHHVDGVTRARHAGQADDLGAVARLHFLHLLAAAVRHRADAAVVRAGDDGVTQLQRAFLHQHRGDGPRPRSSLAFDDGAHRRTERVGGQLEHLGLEGQVLQQEFQVLLRLRGDGHHDGVPAPLFRHEFVGGQVLLHAVQVRGRQVHLVDGDDDGHLRRLRVLDGLHRLGHHAVVRGHHQHHDVRHVGATGAHGREGLVARRVEERHVTARGGDAVRADVLGDATRLALRDAGLPDGVQEARLAVVDVAHDGDDRRTGTLVLGTGLHLGQVVLHLEAHAVDLPAVVAGDHLRRVRVHQLVRGGHLPQAHQLLDELGAAHTHALAQVGHGDALLQLDDLLLLGHLGDLRLGALLRGLALLATDGDGDAAPDHVRQFLLGHALRITAGALALATLLVLGDVHQFAATAQVVRDHLVLTPLGDARAARRHGVLLGLTGRGRHAAHLDERARDDDGLGRRGTGRARGRYLGVRHAADHDGGALRNRRGRGRGLHPRAGRRGRTHRSLTRTAGALIRARSLVGRTSTRTAGTTTRAARTTGTTTRAARTTGTTTRAARTTGTTTRATRTTGATTTGPTTLLVARRGAPGDDGRGRRSARRRPDCRRYR